jgi:hypothetical protein
MVLFKCHVGALCPALKGESDMTTTATVAIPALTPTGLNMAGVKLDDALWLHGHTGAAFTKALATERGNRILQLVRSYGSP